MQTAGLSLDRLDPISLSSSAVVSPALSPVNEAVRNIASIYSDQVKTFCRHRAATEKNQQTRCELEGDKVLSLSKIQRSHRDLEEITKAQSRRAEYLNQSQDLETNIKGLNNELALAKSLLSPIQSKIELNKAEALDLAQQVSDLEVSLNSMKQLINMDVASMDCSHVIRRLAGFFKQVDNLSNAERPNFNRRLDGVAVNESILRLISKTENDLMLSLHSAASDLMKCTSIDEFPVTLQRVRTAFQEKLAASVAFQESIVKGKVGFLAFAIAAPVFGLMINQLIKTLNLARTLKYTPLNDVAVMTLALGGFLAINSLLMKSAAQKLRNLSDLSKHLNIKSGKAFDKIHRAMLSDTAKLSADDHALYQQWAALQGEKSELVVSTAVQSFMSYCASEAPLQMLHTKQAKMLKSLQCESRDEVEVSSQDLSLQLEGMRERHAELKLQDRQFRSELQNAKDRATKLESERQHGAGKKWTDQLAALRKKLNQAPSKSFDAMAFEQLEAELHKIENALARLNLEESDSNQAYQIKLQNLERQAEQLKPSASNLDLMRQQVRDHLGYGKDSFNTMWNRHIDLGPEQLLARTRGLDGIGSMGQSVPGLHDGQNASSYATPSVALSALLDVAQALTDWESSGESPSLLVEHKKPVGLIAIASSDTFQTADATLVQVLESPATFSTQRSLHLHPVKSGESVSLTLTQAKMIHELSRRM